MPFKIQEEYANKTIRIPLSLVKEIESIMNDKKITFSKFIILASRYALDNMEEDWGLFSFTIKQLF